MSKRTTNQVKNKLREQIEMQSPVDIMNTAEIKTSFHRAEMLVAINAALLQATDEASILAAVASYAGTRGAAGVLLTYVKAEGDVHSIDFKPVARWMFNKPNPYGAVDVDSEEKFHDLIIEIRELTLEVPGNIVYIENAATDERLSESSRADFLTKYAMRSEAVLGLYSGGRWQGSLVIIWNEPHHFTDGEQYIFEQIVQNLSAVVATRRAYLAEQEAREEATTLYKVSEAVNAAQTYDELLEAVAVLEPQADVLYLYIWDNFDFEGADFYEVTTIHELAGQSPIQPGHRLRKSDFPFSGRFFPERYWFVEDTYTDERVDSVSRASWDALNTRAILMVRLVYGDTRIGSIAFHSAQPRAFSARKRRLALAIGDLVTAAVERIRLQQNMQASVEAQRAAYIAEQNAREEASLLYQASEAINMATTFAEVIKAIAPLARQIERIYLILWEHLDYRKASYFEIAAGIDRKNEMPTAVGSRFTEANFPIAPQVVKARQLAIEDINDHPLVDPVTRAGWANADVRSLLLVALVQNQRWYGTLSFESSTPQQYSERDRRLTLAISDLVSSAVIRIQAQQEMASAHEESAFLYRLAGEINAAKTYQEIVNSVSRLQPDSSGIFLTFFENMDLSRATYADTVASASVSEEMLPHVRPRVPNVPVIDKIKNDRIWISEDFYTDPRFDEATRDHYRNIPAKSAIVIPMRTDERLWGMLTFYYPTPHLFSELDRRVALGIGDLVSTAVERIRLQQETTAAKEEADFLYKLAEQINAATSYQAILDAAVHLVPDSEGLFLNLCENFDYDTATYFDVPVGANVPEYYQWMIGQHVPKSDFPIVAKIRNQRLVVIEDIQNDPQVDKVSRANWEYIGTRALMAVTFEREGRLMGWLLFVRSQPYQFSEHDRRLALGIGDLVKAAIERVHLQRETIEAKEEADLLYRLAEQINGATTYQAVLDAVTHLMPDFEGIYLNLFEHFDYDRASYFEVPVAANSPDSLREIVGARISKADYPSAAQFVGQRIIAVEDIANDPNIDEISKASSAETGTRSMLVVTFHREERLFGWLFFNSSRIRHYSERELRLALGVGDLAKAAVERIHLQQETETAQRRAETLANLNASFSRAVNEIDLLRAFVPYAESIGAYRVEMAYAEHFRGIDPYASYLIALWMDGEYTDYRQPGFQPRHVLSHQYLLGDLWLPHPDKIMYSEDIGADTRFDARRRAQIKSKFQLGAAIILPLVHAGEFQGLISVNWRESHTFTEEERFILERLVQTLPAVIATRRIYLSEQEARAENELLYTVGKDINRAKTNADVMEAIKQVFPEPLYVAIFMWENYDRNKATYTETVISTDPGLPPGTRMPRDVFDLAYSSSNKMQVINDSYAVEWKDDLAAASARRFEIASVAFTNLTENQRVVGVFAIGCKTQRNFTAREIRLMSGVSELTGAALERFRLRDETERARQRAHDLAALEERTRLARELHDSVSQALYGIGLGAQTAFRSLDKNPTAVRESIEYVLALAAAGLAEMRALIFELRPESLETEGLSVALAKQGASIQARHGIEVHIEITQEPDLVLSSKESLYRVAREALHNVVKHAGASSITLRMRCDQSKIRLDVIDNGVGFETTQEFPGHLGLHSMRERVAQLGGQIDIASKPGNGTQLTVVIPL